MHVEKKKKKCGSYFFFALIFYFYYFSLVAVSSMDLLNFSEKGINSLRVEGKTCSTTINRYIIVLLHLCIAPLFVFF